MHHLIENLNWRYATKKFDPSKRVSTEKLGIIEEAVRLAATSYGLQPFQLYKVEDAATREKLQEVAYGQSQITEGTALYVFCAKTNMPDDYVDDYMQRISLTRGVAMEKLEGFGKTIKGQVNGMDPEAVVNWNKRQAYIALGHLLIAAAEVRVDACPMEGFEAEKFDEILDLKSKGLTATVIAPVGHRSEADGMQHAPKVRLPAERLVVKV